MKLFTKHQFSMMDTFRKFTLVLSFVFLWLSFSATAQNQELWSADLDGKEISWLKMSPNKKVLLVGDKKFMTYGVDANSGKVLWESKGTRPILGKLFTPAAVKDEMKDDLEGYFNRRVFFDEQAEDPKLRDVVALFDATKSKVTLINVNTGKVLNAMPDSEVPMPAFFLSEDRVLTGGIGVGTRLVQLPEGKTVWQNNVAISEDPPIDDQLDVYANSTPALATAAAPAGRGVKGGKRALAPLAALPHAESAIAKISGKTGETLWQVSQNKKERFANLRLTRKQDKLLFYRLKQYDNQLQSIEAVDTKSGQILWSFDVSKEKASMEFEALSPDGSTYYVVLTKNKRVDFIAIDMATGQERWAQEFKLKKEDNPKLVSTDYGAAIVSLKRIRMFDMQTGNEMWEYKYGSKMVGTLLPANDGSLLLFYDNDIEAIDPINGDGLWDSKGGTLRKLYDDRMLVDFKSNGSAMIRLKDGERLWKNKIAISRIVADVDGIGIVYKEDTKKGQEMNILNPETGNPVWAQPIKDPGAQILTEDRKMIIYSENTLVKVDPDAGKYDIFARDIEFEEKEKPSRIERRPNGYLLSSNQNLMMLDFEGNVLWHKHLESVPQSAFKKALAIAGAAAAIAASAAATSQAAADSYTAGYARGYGDYSAARYYQNRADAAMDVAVGFASLAGDAIAMFKKRFSATQSTNKFTFMLTKEGKDIKIVKLNKGNGERENELIFKEREPVYQYDSDREQLYYRTDKSVLTCFKF